MLLLSELTSTAPATPLTRTGPSSTRATTATSAGTSTS